MAKSNLPFTMVGEKIEYQRLYDLPGTVGRNMTTTGSYSFTSLSSGTTYSTTTGGEYAVFLQLQNALANYDIIDTDFNNKLDNSNFTQTIPYAVATGSANTYAITLSPAPTAYTDGMAVAVKINVDSTGASTININSLGAKSIVDTQGNTIPLKANMIYTMRYESVSGKFIVQGGGGSSGGGLSITSPQLWAF